LRLDLTHNERELLINAALESVAEKSPKAALLLLESVDEGKGLVTLAPDVVRRLARADLQKAFDYAAKLPGNAQQDAYGKLLSALSEESPKAAIDWVIANPKKLTEGLKSLESLTAKWADSAPEQVIQLAQNLHAGEQRDCIMGVCIRTVVSSGPERAAELLAQISESFKSRVELVNTVATGWGKTDPATAAKWVLSQPNPQARQSASGALVEVWAKGDVAAAAAWADKLSDPHVRDSAVSKLSQVLTVDDPKAAAEWALTISDEDILKSRLRKAVRWWGGQYPAAARQWVTENQKLADAERNWLLQKLK
jgi:hypothetical protein